MRRDAPETAVKNSILPSFLFIESNVALRVASWMGCVSRMAIIELAWFSVMVVTEEKVWEPPDALLASLSRIFSSVRLISSWSVPCMGMPRSSLSSPCVTIPCKMAKYRRSSAVDAAGSEETPVSSPKSAPTATKTKAEPVPVPAGTLVVTPYRPGARVPFVYLRQDGAYLVLYDMDRLEAVRSELFGPEKLDLMVETLKESHPEAGVLHLGADLEVPISRLVEVADLLRHRCRIQSMSGRCIERERWLASVVLFASPAGRFSLVPDPPPASPLGPTPYHPSMDTAPVAGLCPLKEVQEAAASHLEAMRACLGDLSPRPDVTLSFRWHVAGRLDLVATDPPLPEERVRCLKASLSEPAATRDTACDAALLLKAHPDSIGSAG